MTEPLKRLPWSEAGAAAARAVGAVVAQRIGEALEQADEALFSAAVASTTAIHYHDAIGEIRVRKTELAAAAAAILDKPAVEWADKPQKKKNLLDAMSLVDESDMGSTLARTEMAAKFRTASNLWPVLAGVLSAANPDKQSDEGPFQPDGLARALAKLVEPISPHAPVRAVIEKSLERTLTPRINEMLAAAIKSFEGNGWIDTKPVMKHKKDGGDSFLAAADALRGLKLNIGGKRSSSEPRTVASGRTLWGDVDTSGSGRPEPLDADMLKRRPIDDPHPSRIEQHEPRSEGWGNAISKALAGLFGIFKGGGDNDVDVADIDDNAVQMVNLLNRRREIPQKVMMGGDSGNDPVFVDRTDATMSIPPDLLDRVLTEAQKRLPAGIRACVHQADRSLAQQIKYNLIRNAEAIRPDMTGAILTSGDDDAVDVVGMMFEVFVSERNLDGAIKEEIARLSIPYIRLARSDRKLFMQRTHPARHLLNAIAEACEGNTGETAADLALLDCCRRAIDGVCAGFDGSGVDVFVAAEAAVVAGANEHRQKMEPVEQRSVDAQKDRDLLEKARSMAMEAFDANTVGWPSDLRNAVGPYWQTHRALIISQNGSILEQSQADGLLIFMDQARGGRIPEDERSGYAQVVEAMLASNGITGPSAAASERVIWDAVQTGGERKSGPEPSENLMDDISALLAQLGGTAVATTTDSMGGRWASATADMEFSEDETLALRSYFEKMAVGTWVDFIGDDGGLKAGKLSWVSPISMRLMFVNRKGARMSVESIDDLIGKVLRGSVRLRTDDPAFDRSLKQAIVRLETVLVRPDVID